MKRILLLAAIHALIINQSSKNAKGRSGQTDKKKLPPKEIINNFSQQTGSDKDFALAVFSLGEYNRIINTRQ